MMKIGIFGGTFNPPHIGHTAAVKQAQAELGLDRVLVVPTADPPHKELPAGSPCAEDRLEMARRAMQGLAGVEVSDIELRRGGKSYTWDTLRRLRERYPGAEFYLIMGADMFLSLLSWQNSKGIIQAACIAVLARENDRHNGQLEAFARELTANYGAKITVLRNSVIDISSTILREEIARGICGEYLDARVFEYIREKKLYCAGRYDFDALRAYNKSVLSAKRYAHVLGCEKEAVKLARRWHSDEDAARAAALLHDITKEPDFDQLNFCAKYGIILDAVEKNAPKLLHAKTGAVLAREKFAVPDDVYDAILYHTTGREGMSLLEKVIFMADYIEPTRDFEGLDRLRRLAYEDLDKAMILGLKMTEQEIEARGCICHENSKKALSWLLKGNEE